VCERNVEHLGYAFRFGRLPEQRRKRITGFRVAMLTQSVNCMFEV
jgi:hypothetical protein